MLIKIKEFIVRNKTNIIVIVLILVSLVSIVMQNISSKSKIEINGQEVEQNKYEDKIAVYIAGEVVNPGVYYVDEDYRLDDLIKDSGGLTNDADISEINLAEKLNDSDKIEIPKISVENVESNTEESGDSGLININKATKDELKTLNGIGDTLADNIIEYRKNNKFESIEDILNVNGVGESKYNNIKEYICVN